MKKMLFILVLLSLLIVGCGSESKKTVTRSQPDSLEAAKQYIREKWDEAIKAITNGGHTKEMLSMVNNGGSLIVNNAGHFIENPKEVVNSVNGVATKARKDVKATMGQLGEQLKPDDQQIYDVVVKYEAAQNNVSYKTVTGTEGTEYMSASAKKDWFKTKKNEKIIKLVKDEKCVSKFEKIDSFKVIKLQIVDVTGGIAEVDVKFTQMLSVNAGPTKAYKRHLDVILLRENNLWLVLREKII